VLDNVSLELGKQREQFKLSIESKSIILWPSESFNRQFQVWENEKRGGLVGVESGTWKDHVPCGQCVYPSGSV